VVLASGANTYLEGTTVLGGATLSVDSDAELGNASGGITLQGGELLTTATAFSSARAINLGAADSNDILAAVTSKTATYTGVISGGGDLTVGDGTHTGTVVLTGNNTYTGGLTIINVLTTLQIGNGGPTGSIPGNVLDFGNLAFKRSDDIIFSGIVSGTGTLSQISPGTLTLTGDNTYSGGTIISHNGTISVDSDPELGAEGPGIGGITLQSGELLTTADGFNTARAILVSPASLGPDILAAANNTTAIYNWVISGAGLLDIGDGTNTGNIVFTGTNTYSGGTTIFGVTLQIGIGGTNGSIVGNVLDFGNLTFDRSNAITFAGVVSGAGTLNQIGSGTLTLTGTNTYSGGTFVSGGGTVSVATDANLGATGVGIGGITLQNGELLTTANFTSARSVSLNPVSLSVGAVTPFDGLVAPNILAAAANTTATYTGLVFGTGGLTIGDGTRWQGGVVQRCQHLLRRYDGGRRRHLECRHRCGAGGHQRGDHADGGRVAHHRDWLFQRTGGHA
jgi:fibronectin-binding autotransporter adhesin